MRVSNYSLVAFEESGSDGLLTKYLGGLVGYLLFISIRCSQVGVLRIDDVDVSEVEAEWVIWCIVSGCLELRNCCWCSIKSSNTGLSWSSVLGLGGSSKVLDSGERIEEALVYKELELDESTNTETEGLMGLKSGCEK